MCTWDIGGPLACDGKLTGVAGVASFTKSGCLNSTGVYTKIHSYIDWIESNLEPEPIVSTTFSYKISWCIDDYFLKEKYCSNFCRGFIFNKTTIITAAHCCNAIGNVQL